MNEQGGSTAVVDASDNEPSKRPLDPELVALQAQLKGESRPSKESALQQHLDDLVSTIELEPSRPDLPEVVAKEKKDWREFEWKEEDKEKVKDKLRTILNLGQLKSEEQEQILETTLENLLATGRTANDIDALLTQERITEIKSRMNSNKDIPGEEPDENSGTFDTRDGRAWFLMNLGISQDNVYKAILPHEFHDMVKEKALKIPGDLIDVAWNIIASNPGEFGVNGKYPVLEMRVGKDATGKVSGRYCVNEANFMRFIRSRINDIHGNDPDAANDFFGGIQFSHSYGSLTVGTMFLDNPKYFSDETGVKYEALYNQALMEVWMMNTIKKYDVEYKGSMEDGKKLLETLAGLFRFNTLTKNVAGKSLFYAMSTLPLHFNREKPDSKMGQAWNKIFLAYYNLSDFKALQEVLGKESSFFTKEGMQHAIDEVYKKKVQYTSMPNLASFLKDKEKHFEAAFSKKNNNVIDETDTYENNKKRVESFIKFVNYLGEFGPSGDHIKVIATALEGTVNEGKEGLEEEDRLDDHSKGMAGLIAQSLIRVFGAGTKNDTGMTAFDKQVETQYTEGYRRKMATTKRGGSAGNPFTIPMFHGLSMDFLRGSRVGTAVKEYTFIDKDGKPQTVTRTKTVHEVMMDMQQVSGKYAALRDESQSRLREAEAAGNEQAVQEARAKIAELDAKEQAEFKLYAGELEFKENALLNWVSNHQVRARQVYDQIAGAAEINFEKFTKYDSLLRGVSFDRAAFQEAVNDKFLKPLRYLFATYGDLNMNMPIRVLKFKGRKGDDDDVWEWEDGYLGEALFGHQILDIPEFRKKAKELTDEDKDKGYRKAGKYIKDADGNFVIDYNKVQADQTLVWKQWALMKMGADLWSHISNHSTDPAYGLAHYIDVLEAIESIPGGVEGSDKDMRGTRVVTPFFDHAQIKWLRQISGTTNLKLYTRAIFTDIFTGKHRKGGVFDESTSLFLGAVFKGY